MDRIDLMDERLPAKDPLPSSLVKRFCTRCGAAWQVEWTACGYCERPPARAMHAMTVSDEKRSIKVAIWLYGALLAVSGASILVELVRKTAMGFSGLAAESIAFALITSMFVIGCRHVVMPAYRRAGGGRWYLLAAAISVGTFLMASGVLKFLHGVLGLEEFTYLPIFTSAGHGVPMALFLVAVAPAVTEEAAFRGVIYGLLNDVLSPWETIFVTAGMFAILHLSLPALPQLFVLGVVLAWLRKTSGSIYPGILLHFTHNALCIWSEHSGIGASWLSNMSL
jgi:membrane protease YdiL (CAAX protease family)